MLEENSTQVEGDKLQSDTAADPIGVKTEDKATPKVEMREGKLYIDGNRAYTRDETNKIASTARMEAEKTILQSLEVDDINAVKEVIRTLRSAEGNENLNVSALRDTVKRKEQTVDELNREVKKLRTELVLNKHMTQLYSAMPTAWTEDQRTAVIDLMRARNMIQVEGDQFQIRNGDSFLTQDGERPDYKGAVELIGKTIGLNFGKTGVPVANGERLPTENRNGDRLDEDAIRKDPRYRNAYTHIRTYQPSLTRSQITDSMVKAKMEEMKTQMNFSQVGQTPTNPNIQQPNRRR